MSEQEEGTKRFHSSREVLDYLHSDEQDELLQEVISILTSNYYSLHLTGGSEGSVKPNIKYITSVAERILAKVLKHRLDRDSVHQYHLRFYSVDGSMKVSGHWEIDPLLAPIPHLRGDDLRHLTSAEKDEIWEALCGQGEGTQDC